MGKHKEKSHKRKRDNDDSATDDSGTCTAIGLRQAHSPGLPILVVQAFNVL